MKVAERKGIVEVDIVVYKNHHVQPLREAIAAERPLEIRLSQGGLPTIQLAITMRTCLLYTSPSPRDRQKSRMPSSA